jgi:hypothetical protein
MKVENKSFERVEQFKYLRTALTKEIAFMKKSRTD